MWTTLESPVDEVYPECEVSVVDIKAVRTLVHGAVTPLGGLGWGQSLTVSVSVS